jgi:peptide deformylase
MRPALEEALWLTNTLPIKLFGDPVLMAPCADVTTDEFASGQAATWGHDLDTFMTSYREHTGMGRGLAANQIGISKRIIWIWDGHQPIIFFNPQVTAKTGKAMYPESCISSAALIIGDVIRDWEITIAYKTHAGKAKAETYDGLMARLLQHEIDHLDGHVCSDRYLPDTIRMATADKSGILTPEFKRLA